MLLSCRITSAIANSFQVATKSRISSAASTGSEIGQEDAPEDGEMRSAVDQRGLAQFLGTSLKKPCRMNT